MRISWYGEYLGSSFIYSGTENVDFLQKNISHVEKAKLTLGILL